MQSRSPMCQIPSSPGTYELKVCTWRPRPQSWLEYVNAFFLGLVLLAVDRGDLMSHARSLPAAEGFRRHMET
eukprot:759932-Hanusia_phi.AAC.5